MESTKKAFKHIAVVAHPMLPEAVAQAQGVADFLIARGVQVTAGILNDKALKDEVRANRFDLVITLGGDGTVLRAGHLCAPYKIPILGINMGHLGFLIELDRDNWQDALEKLLAGDYWCENRMMLETEHWRGEQKLGKWLVVNEAVVSRGEWVRPVHLVARLDGHLLATYVADALIVATPTGSTAYALAAGGPVLPPQLRNVLLMPVAPHLSMDRAVVLAEGAEVSMEVITEHTATLSIDGQEPVALEKDDRVDVRVSEHALQFIRFQDADYFYRNLVSLMDQNPAIGERNP